MGIKDNRPVGLLPLGRPTFDVPFAEEMLGRMIAAVEQAGFALEGPRALLFDADATRAAIADLKGRDLSQVLVLQVTFTDASMVVEAASAFDLPLSVWAVPEPRVGGRLRLNSFCGLNLAAHALGLNDRAFGWLYAAPDAADIAGDLRDLLSGGRMSRPIPLARSAPPTGRSVIAGARLARIGRHPDGFDTCAYDSGKLAALAGVTVDAFELSDMFSRAAHAPEADASTIRAAADEIATGLDLVDQPQLDRSLRLKSALDSIRAEGGYDALAVRCWPETFTEYGGAVCGPVAMLGEARVPCACEADVYGALTALLLQRVADAPAFLADLVDVDTADDTAVVWHCGQAPASMADPEFAPRATIHTNRKMPLLFEFPLKPGRVTFFRISQARGQTFALIGGGEMLRRPMAYTGTSGTVRFDSGAATALQRIMNAAIEHHMALAYGDHRDELRTAAADLGIPVLEL
jgi:L-fucose isomerase-like protein